MRRIKSMTYRTLEADAKANQEKISNRNMHIVGFGNRRTKQRRRNLES